MTSYYRWYVVNNQDTCFTSIVELVDGYFPTEKDVEDHLKERYNFKERMFSVRKILESELPDWLYDKI